MVTYDPLGKSATPGPSLGAPGGHAPDKYGHWHPLKKKKVLGVGWGCVGVSGRPHMLLGMQQVLLQGYSAALRALEHFTCPLAPNIAIIKFNKI